MASHAVAQRGVAGHEQDAAGAERDGQKVKHGDALVVAPRRMPGGRIKGRCRFVGGGIKAA